MSRLPPSDAAEAALDRALSVARTPAVPVELAARIVARVTELPQPSAAEKSISQARDEQPRRKRGLAVAFGAVVVIGGVALSGLWPSENTPAIDRPVFAASAGKLEEPRVAANGGEDLARSEPKTELGAPIRTPKESAAGDGAFAPEHTPEAALQIPALSGESAIPIVPYEEAAPQLEVELAERSQVSGSDESSSPVAVAAGPAGPASSNGNDAISGTMNGPIAGPPVPQGLGITGSPTAAPAPAIKSGPAGRRPPPSRR